MYVRNDGPDDEAGEEPHEGHADAENQSERPPFASDVFRGKLDSGKDKLDAEDDACEMVCDEVKVLAGEVGILKRADEIGDEGRKYYARKGCEDCVCIVSV